ncbi:MAG: hypothetical protein M3162_04385, partial [Thermoproteota archaeon]|nr:hypothetical protein [Thermoproteota archaeon]
MIKVLPFKLILVLLVAMTLGMPTNVNLDQNVIAQTLDNAASNGLNSYMTGLNTYIDNLFGNVRQSLVDPLGQVDIVFPPVPTNPMYAQDQNQPPTSSASPEPRTTNPMYAQDQTPSEDRSSSASPEPRTTNPMYAQDLTPS